jgi:hypothetical protein
MALQTPCQTPGCNYIIDVRQDMVQVTVIAPRSLYLTPEEAKVLESNIHNAMELVLKPYFQ